MCMSVMPTHKCTCVVQKLDFKNQLDDDGTMPLIPAPGRQKQVIFENSRPTWSREQVLGHPELHN